ncbi:hypothetical protein [Streptomyces sp. NBC_01465]|uniref:hypothetical protein n=1 Tax=Streptomyces sp. NBC_01465 TaxID=2903878 RepID=UPI002E2EBCB9|nr:hypothetical protein [Streptomyces sp. NBC_01465]
MPRRAGITTLVLHATITHAKGAPAMRHRSNTIAAPAPRTRYDVMPVSPRAW